MKDFIAQNRASREAVLGRVRRALGKTGPDDAARDVAHAYVAAHAHGPRPAMPEDLVQRFLARASDMASTVERIASVEEIPTAVARYLAALKLPPSLAMQQSRSGVCWPEFGGLDWQSQGLDIQAQRIDIARCNHRPSLRPCRRPESGWTEARTGDGRIPRCLHAR